MAISYANALAEQIDFSGLVATRVPVKSLAQGRLSFFKQEK
jgi:hypothetical protein